ncbi:MAG: ferrous iron transport protein A [Ruminococcus sp.]|jgi:ferrous iron transport protein A|nr:ferrous iron transport protein A [Ruminococcus sp.]
MKTLNDIKIGQSAKVIDVSGNAALRRHILDMGVTKGTDVTIKKAAPLGDPIQISVRGYELSLRRDDAKLISVEA